MANPLAGILKMFLGSNQSVLGIDIGGSSIKVVQIRKKGGRAILETYGELALGPYNGLEVGRATSLPAEKLAEALKDVMREAHVTTTQCGIAIPLQSSLVSIVPMPALPESQLSSMIPLEARKYIPVPISEVTLDWSIIPTEEEGEESNQNIQTSSGKSQPKPKTVDVLVVAIHNESISKYQTMAEQAGLQVSFFEIEIFSTIRSVMDHENLPVMIIDMGSAATKIYVIEKGVIRVSHTVNRGSQDITLAFSRAFNLTVKEAEMMKRENGAQQSQGNNAQSAESIANGSLEYVFSEANRVVANYQHKYNKNISKTIVTGGGVNLKGFAERAKERVQMTIEVANPFAKVDAPAFLEDVLKQAGSEFTVAIGVALRRLQELE